MVVGTFRCGAASVIMVLAISIKLRTIWKKKQYHSILQGHAIPSGLKLCRKGFALLQDNDPKHTSHLHVQELLEKKRGERRFESYGFSASISGPKSDREFMGSLKARESKT